MPNSTTVEVSQKIAAWLRIPPRPVPSGLSNLEEILRCLEVRIRAISLKENWYRQDGLPLLAFRSEQPIALLPSWRGYFFWESPQQNGRVDAHYAQQLNSEAFACYRVFPDKLLNLWDMCCFGWRGTGYALTLLLLLTGILPLLMVTLFSKGAGYIWILAIVVALFIYAQDWLLRNIAIRVNGTQQAALWDRVLRLPVPENTEIEMIPAFTTMPYLLLVLALIEMILFTIAAFWIISPLPVLAVVLIPMVLILLFNRQNQPEAEQDYHHWLRETMPHLVRLRLVAVPLEKLWQQKYSAYQQQIELIRTSSLSLLISLSMPLLAALFYSVINWSAWLMFYFLVMAVFKFCNQLNAVMQLDYRPLLEWIRIPPATPLFSRTLSGKLCVENLCYETIQNLSFKAAPGNLVFVTGSAKTTLLKLLLGILRPETGEILYDEYPPVRSQIGSYFEDSQIHAGNILANIVGFRSLPTEAVMEAVRLAALEDWLKTLPMGLNTILDDGGSVISQGQRQRILLARALVHKPPILLLDNPFHALDHETQQQVMQNLRLLPATKIIALDEIFFEGDLMINL